MKNIEEINQSSSHCDCLENKWVHQLVEEQAQRTPDAVAVIWENQQLTYRELNRHANQLAHYLQELGVGQESVVGLYLERSLARIVGLLAILKMGGVYLPLDPAYPQERLTFMLRDSQASAIITQDSLIANLQTTQATVINLDHDKQAIATQTEDNPLSQIAPNHLAYLIYTSGSTGTPKGVLVEHQAIALHCQTIIAHFELTKGDRVLQFASVGFDVSLEQILPTLIVGATLILSETRFLTGLTFHQKLLELGLSVVNVPPAYWTQWLQSVEENPTLTPLTQLRLVICGGEAMPPAGLKLWQNSHLKAVRLLNAYGPTETTITAMTFEVPPERSFEKIPIGFPLTNRQVYVLDAQQQAVPVGVAGELYIGGDGLARGYLNRPELTAERFIPNPFFAGRDAQGRDAIYRVSTRLYKTGDLARYLSNGNIEFLGRIDHQVKIRGFRIELAEIEAILQQHPQVRETVVLVREDILNNKRLVAYLISSLKREESSFFRELRSFLGQKLPDYMIPAAFVVLEQFPLTPNGKIDRNALPVPDLADIQTNFMPPRNPQEEILANIWAEVLRVESVGIEDNFFELGGHSLLATQVISRIREAFSVELPLKVLFESPTIAEFAPKLAQTNTSVIIPSIKPRTQTENIPLSFAQERLWFLNQLEGTSATYNISTVLRLQGKLNVLALQQALETIIDRHEILRTNFIDHNGYPLQVIVAPHHDLPLIDLQNLPEEEQNQQLQQFIQENTQYAFNLATEPLLKTRLLRLEKQSHLLLLTVHHIIADGWSMGILIEELSSLYQAYSQGQTSPLETLPIQYADFALWQQQHFSSEVLTPQLNYWKQQLAELPSLLSLPTDRPRPAVQTFSGSSHFFELPTQLTQQLKTFSQESGVTLYMTLLAVLSVLLSRYTHQSDIPIGSAIANRNRRELESLIGFFVNTLVLRVELKENPRFTDLLKQVRQVALEAYAHQDLPFEKLVEELQPIRSLSYHPLFQVMFVWQNTPQQQWEMPDLTIKEQYIDNYTAKFDLTLSLEEVGETIQGFWEYSTDLFEEGTIERMMGHFQTLLEAIITNPEQRVEELPLLTAAEREQLLVAWNQTQTDYPTHQCIHQIFEEQVTKTPDAIAVVYEKQQLTYRQLNEKANQLAHYLRSLGVSPDVLISICLERSLQTIISILGILKAGGAYLPLDPVYPTERLAFMLEDAQVSILITQQSLIERLPIERTQVICIDSDWVNITVESQENPLTDTGLDKLAYVMYTSGSTGQPKGVCIPHRGVVRLVKETNYINFSPEDVFLQLAPIAFDASTFEIWGSLLNGAKLVLFPNHQPSLAEIGQAIAQHHITTLWLTAGLFHLMVDERLEDLKPLRYLLAGGDVLSVAHVQKVLSRLENVQLINGYGPTENTTFTCCYPIAKTDSFSHSVPIGHPIANTQVYILDQHLQPVAIGVAGELYIGGDGLAQGYLNRPELTAEKFISNPFQRKGKGERGKGKSTRSLLYKTGDLARYLPDGNIEFLGRIDNQVKIRGFRIELAEIESVLQQHPDVRESLVLVREDIPNNQRLIAYIIPTDVTRVDASISGKLRSFLGQKLPDYMIPAAFVVLEEFPLTPNGKINRRILPIPDLSDTERTFVAPRNPHEEILANIWAEVLRVKSVGITDNFFELGGHSLLATQVISRIREAFSVELPLRTLFESPTITEFAQKLSTASNNSQLSLILPVSRDQKLPLSFAQQRLWFLKQLEPDSTAYNMLYGFRLQGILNLDALEQSFRTLIGRYEVLRTIFPTMEGEPSQIILHDLDFTLSVIDLQNLALPQRNIETQRLTHEEGQYIFNLAQSPLFRVKLLCLDEQEHLLLLNIHHIIFDGWSSQILFTDLTTLYQSFAVNQSPTLLKLSLQYADFALWQRKWLSGNVLESQLAYWKQQLTGMPPLLNIPTDKPRPTTPTFCGNSQDFVLSVQLTQQLKQFSQESGVTLYMTLLAVLSVLLSRYTHQSDIPIGSAIANRNRRELESLIGFFVNTLVLRVELKENPRFTDLLKQVRKVALEAYAHQDLPFEKLVEELQPIRSLSYHPLFQVMLVWQNTPQQQWEMPDLTIKEQPIESHTAKFDLTLSLEEAGETIQGFWEYSTDLFTAETIKRMMGHFQTLLEAIITHPEQRVEELPLLTTTEREQLLVAWNQTQTNYPTHQCIHQLFEEQVEKTPDAIAVVYEKQQLTYRQLNEKANQLAHYLRSLGVLPDVLVGICLERSLEMVVSLLGILKAGGAYLPLDPVYPVERLAFMLEDAQVSILLTQQSLIEKLPSHQAQVICLDSDWAKIDSESTENLCSSVQSHHLAYVIYTSGSTGIPKGVQIPHCALVNFLRAMESTLEVTAEDVWCSVTTITFDIAALELYLPLIVGMRLVLISREVARDGIGLSKQLTDSGATIMQATPSTWQLLLAAQWQGCSQLKILCGGEALSRTLAHQLLQRGACLWNLYGPTETTIWSIVGQVMPEDEVMSIGKAIANTQVYILDQYLQPVAIGIAGELYIGGDGLARGYLNCPELTAERFIPNPFLGNSDAKLYKTGDLARYLPDGKIEFLGRMDNQVKIRGFRIELGEIEAVLNQHPNIQETVVMVREDIPQDKRLIAYILPNSIPNNLQKQLRSLCQQKLPKYMIPSAFVVLEQFPLTPNGKINRRAFPLLNPTESEETFVPPRTELERQLTQIWQKVLGIDSVSIKDSFFDLGGHSLLAVRLFTEIEQKLGKNIPLATLFQASSVEEFAILLNTQGESIPESAVVSLHPNGDKPPFFFVNSISYAQILAPYLGDDQPFYALNIFGLTEYFTQQVALLSLENVAAKFIEDMKTVQPEGPYFLVTYCRDSFLLFEMAQQLHEQGAEVAFLAFIDTIWEPLKLESEGHWYNIRRFGLSYILKKIKNKFSFIQEETNIRLNQFRGRLLMRNEDLTSSYLEDVNLLKAYEQAVSAYKPQVYPGKITLLLCEELRQRYSPKLSSLVAGGVELHEIPGYHNHLFEPPYIQVLAEKLRILSSDDS